MTRLRKFEIGKPYECGSCQSARDMNDNLLRRERDLLDEAERVVEGLLKCAGRRRPDGHYEFCLVPNRDVEAAKDLITKLRKEKG
jgi:hypothetical protein